MTDVERDRQAFAVFAAVCEAGEGDRAGVLSERCGGDAGLRARVDRLLAADARGVGGADHPSDVAADGFLASAVRAAIGPVADYPTAKMPLRPGEAIAAGGGGCGDATTGADAAAGGEGLAAGGDADGPAGDTYRIVRVVGEGGMGTVYEAEQATPRRRVAVKAIRADLRTPQARRRFEYEAQVLARLEHPGVARLYEANVRPRDGRVRAFLAMEFVDGRHLDEHVRRAKLGVRAKLELFLRVCEPVGYAHRMGVIHRDLKPANILVTADGQPKVLDFGVARTLDPTASNPPLTGDGQFIGTLAYMSPEQLDGRCPVDTRTDVYALGVVLHQLLTGRLPIDLGDAGFASAAHRLSTVVPAPIGRVDRAFRGDLEVIVARALEKDPARRYASVEQLAADVRRHLDGQPIEARADSAIYVLRKAAWRHRGWVAAAAALLAGVSVFAAYASVQSGRNASLAGRNAELATAAAVARDDAKAARAVAERRADDLRRSLYAAKIAYARVSFDQREVVPLRRALDECDPELRRWEWHYLDRVADQATVTTKLVGERITSVDVDDRHRFVAAGTRREGFRVFAVPDGRVLFAGHLGERTRATISNDGSFVVAMGPAEVVAYAVPDGRPLWRRPLAVERRPDPLNVSAVRVSPDRRLVLAADYYGVTILKAADGAVVRRIDDVNQLMVAEFTPGSDGVVLGEFSGRLRRLTLDGAAACEYPDFGPTIHRLGFSRDGALLAAGNYTGRQVFWDLASGRPRLTSEGDGAGVRRFGFSPDDQTVFTAGDDRMVREVDVRTGKVRQLYVGHADGVWLTHVDPTGTQLLTVGRDNVLKLWPIPLPPPGFELAGGPREPGGIAFAPDSATVYAAGVDGAIHVWDRRSGAALGKFGEGGNILCLAGDRAGNRLVTADADGGVRVWDRFARTRQALIHRKGKVAAVAFSPDGNQVVGGDADGTLWVWDATAGAVPRSLKAHAGAVNAVRFHPDGKTVLTGGEDGMLRAWRWPDLTKAAEVKADERTVVDAAISPDGRWVATCGAGRSPSLLDAKTLVRVHRLIGDGGGVQAVTFSPDGTRVVTCGRDGTARVWDVDGGHELLSLRCGKAFVYRAAFSPDGKTLATADEKGSVRLWAGPKEAAVVPATGPSTAPTTRPTSGPAAGPTTAPTTEPSTTPAPATLPRGQPATLPAP